MDWPADISFIVLLFDGTSSEVLWSLRFPPTMPQVLEDGCVHRFVAAQSMVHAFFSDWVPKNSGNHENERWPSPSRVEKIVCHGDTVLAAVPVPGNPRWLFGTFVHCPQANRPDMRYLSPALFKAVVTISGDVSCQSRMPDMSTLVEQLDSFRRVVLPGGTVSHDHRKRRDAKHMVSAFIRLVSLYHETDLPMSNAQPLDRPLSPRLEEPVRDRSDDVSSDQTVLPSLQSNTQQQWFRGFCVLRTSDGDVMHYQGMQEQLAQILSWYFVVLADSEALLRTRYEKHLNGRLRAWVRHGDFVLCFDSLGTDTSQRALFSLEADQKLNLIAAKVLSEPLSWSTSPRQKQSSGSSSIR
jgi:hypothetical protein